MPFDYITAGELIIQVVGWLARFLGSMRAGRQKALEESILQYMIENREPKNPNSVWLHVSLVPVVGDVPFSVAFPPEYQRWQKFAFWAKRVTLEIRHRWRKYWNFVPEEEIQRTMRELRRRGQLELTALQGEFYRLPNLAATENQEMIRGRFTTGAFLLGLGLGAAVTYFFLPQRHSSVPSNWMELTTEREGFGWTSEAPFNVDIPLPTVGKPQGQAKLLDRSEEGMQNILLGYVVKTTIKHLDVTKIPAKYRQPRKKGDLEIEPPKEVVYAAHMDFTLKDADGFVLMSAKSQPLHLFSGQENLFQGIALEPVPLAVAKRTKTILMGLTTDKCETCY